MFRRTAAPMEPRAVRLLSSALVVTLAASPFVVERDFRLSRNSRDTTIVRDIAGEIRGLCPGGGELFTFTPILAVASRMRITPGLEFETFGYFETITREEAERYHLANPESLLRRVRNLNPCVVHLDDRFFRSRGNARRIKGVREELLKAVEDNYHLVRSLEGERVRLLRGRAKILARHP